MPAFLRSLTIVVVETAEIVRFGALGGVPPRPGARQYPFFLDGHESLCDRNGQGNLNNIHPLERKLLVSSRCGVSWKGPPP
ncbi:UNVERIFIED_CONTAM: hypothetical protein Sradi_7038500 [Sesamum radiatum]|uniref:Secreted protein n=1 Tax=Sesamum radiatum TaxID=300843 RepID=A0AAW2J8Q5_SESRA